jgi:hypothetical protein
MTATKDNNPTIKNLNDIEPGKISNNEFKRMMIRMIGKIKKDIYKHIHEFKQNISS